MRTEIYLEMEGMRSRQIGTDREGITEKPRSRIRIKAVRTEIHLEMEGMRSRQIRTGREETKENKIEEI